MEQLQSALQNKSHYVEGLEHELARWNRGGHQGGRQGRRGRPGVSNKTLKAPVLGSDTVEDDKKVTNL